MDEMGYTGTLTHGDIATLNDARLVLREMLRHYGRTWADGIIYGKAEDAEHAIFQLLNAAKHNGDVHVDESELHIGRDS